MTVTRAALVVILVGTASALQVMDEDGFLTREYIESVKSKATTWTPYEYEAHPFKGEDLMKRTGLILPDSHFSIMQTMLKGYSYLTSDAGTRHVSNPVYRDHARATKLGLPTSFDARTQWPSCIHDVRNQKSCGSCWAFSSSGMLEDRFCIASGGAVNVRLSPEDLITCDTENAGCGGGLLTNTINFITGEGIVSEACKPYSSGNGQQGFCHFSCTDPTLEYKKYQCKGGSMVYPSSPEAIQTELMTNGPLQVSFLIYSDFMSYSTGIYEVVDPTIQGGHAVKLIGWDHDVNGRLYWICQNQWGTNWGEFGYFRIFAGEAGLGTSAQACTPKL